MDLSITVLTKMKSSSAKISHSRDHIENCYAKAKKILMENVDILHASAKLLMEKEKITREEFEALFENK